jgi:hypothetical protein
MAPKKHFRKRLVATWLFLLLVEAGLVWEFQQIPNARTLVPLCVTDDPQVFDWSPDNAPRWFHTDDPSVAEAAYFREALQPEIDPSDTTFEQQLAIMDWVRRQAAVADASQTIPGDPITVHQAMLAGVPAQCGNFSTLYVAASTSMGLSNVRTWHFTPGGGWNEYGHIANDVWVPDLGKWVMVDPMNNAYVLVDGAPGSVIEVREALLTGQTDRLEAVVGPNAHTPPERLFELYERTMPIVRMETSNTPLRDYYLQTPAERLIQFVPDIGGLPYYASRVVLLINGEARHITLIDGLSGEEAHQLPVHQSKLVFWAIMILGMVTLSVGAWLLGLVTRQLFSGKSTSRQNSPNAKRA